MATSGSTVHRVVAACFHLPTIAPAQNPGEERLVESITKLVRLRQVVGCEMDHRIDLAASVAAKLAATGSEATMHRIGILCLCQ